jgi:D-sedoheptulose 7-phosphate isomerase
LDNTTEILRAKQYLEEHQRIVKAFPAQSVDRIADVLFKAHELGRTVFLFGNGGSAALASHLACDLGKGTAYCNGRRFRVMSLGDNLATLTAWANDVNYEEVFSEQLRNFVEPGDVAFAISGSGNSKNVLNALRTAREATATTVGMTGFEGGQMKELCDVCAIVPSNDMQIIEDFHLVIAHALFRIVMSRMSSRAMAAFQG